MLVNTGSGDGLLPDGTKPSPEPKEKLCALHLTNNSAYLLISDLIAFCTLTTEHHFASPLYTKLLCVDWPPFAASFEEESPHDITAEDEVFYNPDIAAPAPDVPEAVPEEGAAAEGAAADIKDTKPDNEGTSQSCSSRVWLLLSF